MDRLNPLGQVGSGSLEQPVNMIAENHEGEQFSVAADDRPLLIQPPAAPVIVIVNDIPAGVAARHDMLDRPFEMKIHDFPRRTRRPTPDPRDHHRLEMQPVERDDEHEVVVPAEQGGGRRGFMDSSEVTDRQRIPGVTVFACLKVRPDYPSRGALCFGTRSR
jgi:hypothetical protein